MGEGRAEGTDYISLRISGRTILRNSEGDTILRGYFPFVPGLKKSFLSPVTKPR